MPRGGKRTGAGRKRNPDPTVPVRVPLSQKAHIKAWLADGDQISGLSQKDQKVLIKSAQILKEALKLKANAGGKIKQEIRLVIELLKNLP
jgi:hypothetical protein